MINKNTKNIENRKKQKSKKAKKYNIFIRKVLNTPYNHIQLLDDAPLLTL